MIRTTLHNAHLTRQRNVHIYVMCVHFESSTIIIQTHSHNSKIQVCTCSASGPCWQPRVRVRLKFIHTLVWFEPVSLHSTKGRHSIPWFCICVNQWCFIIDGKQNIEARNGCSILYWHCTLSSFSIAIVVGTNFFVLFRSVEFRFEMDLYINGMHSMREEKCTK